MNASYSLFMAGAIFTGLLFLFRFIQRGINTGLFKRTGLTVVRFHEQATAALIRKRILRFPGISLVPPLQGWIKGESVFLATLVMALFSDLSALDAVYSGLIGLSLGGTITYLSLRTLSRKQIESIRAGLPLASFLLSLMLEAGIGSSAALPQIISALPGGPLSRELADISRSRLIGISRSDAIERSRCRVPLDDYRLFLNFIQQGERLGIGLSQGLRELSFRMMESEGHRGETIAQKAAVKLLFPLVIFIFPSVFLIILSPVILNLWKMAGR